MSASMMQAQITIGGNVYGGGNKGDVGGSTKVVVYQGDLNKVFGGARMANVGGNSYVNIDGENASGYTVINHVYGGNDIAGTIGTAKAVNKTLPAELVGNESGVTNEWNSYVHISTATSEDPNHQGELVASDNAEKLFIGQVFAGGNGDYNYSSTTSGDVTTHTIKDKEGNEIVSNTTGFTRPELDRTYLDIQGGTIFFAHGGGNNATVKQEAVIHVDNPSKVVTEILVDENKLEDEDNGTNLLTDDRINNLMGVRLGQEHLESDKFQIARLYGGNTLADMTIRPTWFLQSGRIRNLYSGGNRGNMTSPEGLLMEIDPKVPAGLELDEERRIKYKLKIDNVYGGCRMANVEPRDEDGQLITVNNLSDVDEQGHKKYHFPEGLAARVLVRGGDINNVYGGNDITGKVYGGNAVGIYTSIKGDVYGGGNGAYAYTDNNDLKNDPTYGDLYYNPGSSSVDALNAFRPNAEQVSIRLHGTQNDPTVIGGGVYCGGNCATLVTNIAKPMIELKMGSYVVADKVFLGNNGEKMVDEAILEKYADNNYSSLSLTTSNIFAKYMDGVAMDKIPSLVYDKKDKDGDDYRPYTSKIGSFFCGGNIGSMTYEGVNEMDFDASIIVYDKVVGGCNNANVPAREGLNARYEGGILGSSDETTYTDNGLETGNIKDRLILKFDSLRIEPRRWLDEKNKIDPDMNLVWNTVHKNLDENYQLVKVPYYDEDGMWFEPEDRRLYGGNVYGGCYNSGNVNGNVVININNDLIVRDEVFAGVDENGNYQNENSGVILDEQGEDVLGSAMNVFGGGYGENTEIWGSTTINQKRGYAFQLFGGGERGYVGKGVLGTDGKKTYSYDSKYSTYVNLCDNTTSTTITATTKGVAETEFLYGGGFDGVICGNSYVHLGNGRVFDVLGGSCNADIKGHVEVYIGKNADGSLGFPYVRGGVYGGNDLGGIIWGERNYRDVTTRTDAELYNLGLLTSNTYVEYTQGRVDSIFGGNYGYYQYADKHYKLYTVTGTGEPKEGFTKPFFNNAFVYFNPVKNVDNYVGAILGGSKGFANEVTNNNSMQEKSYVLIDDTSGSDNFKMTDVFGAGAYAGLGTVDYKGVGRSAIDLFQGHLHNVYGASNREGLVGYTRINVPSTSTIHVNALFGGGKGYEIERINNPDDTEARTSSFCDTYVSCIDYQGENAYVDDAIYGGNHNTRITCDTYLNIGVPVKKDDTGELARVYGAGYGSNTVAGRTNVFLNNGAQVNEVYGGGRDGNVFNFVSLTQWLKEQYEVGGSTNPAADVTNYGLTLTKFAEYINGKAETQTTAAVPDHPVDLPSKIGTYVNSTTGVYDGTFTNDIMTKPDYHNTNVHLMEGSLVRANAKRDEEGNNGGYAYGGGHGPDATIGGTTSIELLGGTVAKDIYGAGWGGSVFDEYKLAEDNDASNDFVAGTNVYIEGGTCRNVYGGGYQGSVGYHDTNTNEIATDILGETNVVIGRLEEDVRADSLTLASNNITKHGFYYGRPAIQRNAYAGGEGGAVYGTGNITINNGYIGYVYNADGTDDAETTAIDERYEENIIDYTYKDAEGNFIPNTNLYDSGCVFGGGYVDNSNVDFTQVSMFGGHIRNSLFGGGEVAAIGRGEIQASGSNNAVRKLTGIYKAGKTNVEMLGGHVHRDVFGGGRGYNNLGGGGNLSLYSEGFVFGQTEVHIHGGEIGTEKELANMRGNVFGGGDIGYVYSAYEYEEGGVKKVGRGIKSGERYDDGKEGYYYEHKPGSDGKYDNDQDFVKDGNEYVPTEDCKVLIEPWVKVIGEDPIEFTDITYAKDQIVSSVDLKWLKKTNSSLLSSINANGKVTAENGIKFTRTYDPGEYVPTYALNTLQNKNADSRWSSLDPTGIIIHNAVFAGGNTAAGSATVYANATSVYGNATASIHDVFHRDLITLGTGHTGGLYGDGNLTFVDGYRGLNITNYGTDYYSISTEIDIDTYHALPQREAAYYELKYKCNKACTDKDGTRYNPSTPIEGGGTTKASTITADDMLVLFVEVDAQGHETSVQVDNSGNRVASGGTPVLVKDSKGKWIPNTDYWKENGVLPVYAGRLMNSIQRADFCGVFGSRMVLQGAQDRVPEIVDYTHYTINRVREVSLNQQRSVIDSDLAIAEGTAEYEKKHNHGNYFGIYNIVNYLGALTSDVHFREIQPTDGDGDVDVRRTDNTSNTKYREAIQIGDNEPYQYGTTNATYYNWKKAKIKDNTRNNGNSYNKVALASGVYLELTTEKSTGKEVNEKDWGYITGVIELDLINVQPGIGGGFVYAKNEHRIGSYAKNKHTTLTALNADAITRKDFTYTDNSEVEWETSGNFVHSTQTIIDDCYNISGRYKGSNAVPAHYWYIKGSVYVYDQYISAYTGTPNAFSQKVEIPLTITSASHGTMKLLDVQPNRYAYYASRGNALDGDKKVVINDVSYSKNDPISYWDWYLLSNSEKELFEEKTYVTIADCKIGKTIYPEGKVMLPSEYETLKNSATTQTIDGKPVKAVQAVTKDENGNLVELVDDKNNPVYKAFDFVFRESNNLSHDTGYILTYKVSNPTVWDTWYTEISSATQEKDQDGGTGYEDGPTYRLSSSDGGVLGQRDYAVGELISKDVYDTYEGDGTEGSGVRSHITIGDGQQATFAPAYIITHDLTVEETVGVGTEAHTVTHHYNVGAAVPTSHSGYTSPAYICTSTIQLSETEFIYLNQKMSEDEKTGYITSLNNQIKALGLGIQNPDAPTADELSHLTASDKAKLTKLQTLKRDINEQVVPAYYCTDAGLYGGNYYESGKNYRALEAWSSMSATDRQKFTFNYDALDLLIDPDFSGQAGKKYQYDGPTYETEDDVRDLTTGNPAGYSVNQPVDYTATYNSSDNLSLSSNIMVKRGEDTDYKTSTNSVQKDDELSRTVYESLNNEQRNYVPITVKPDNAVDEGGTTKYKVYVVNVPFQIGNSPYAVGAVLSASEYNSLTDNDKKCVTQLIFPSTTLTSTESSKTYYYCRESYKVGTGGAGVTVTNAADVTAKSSSGADITKTGTYASSSTDNVPIGFVIPQTTYNDLVTNNQQKNFTIHGISPTETSTFYVSRNSDIFDLSKEKIITAIYQYDYEECDASGNVTPVSERHVVNIHITFKSGVPTVEDIKAPQIVIPGDKIDLREPNVVPGAYEVTGGGWELFETKTDAESHTNGIEFSQKNDPLYWYQDGYYVAYYAKTYLGKSYSNSEPVKVANYHDLKKVIEDTKHHYYIDYTKKQQRDPKIYIKDAENGIDQLKNLFDLSLISNNTAGYTVTDGKITAASGEGANTALVDHALLNAQVESCQRMEFFLKTDIAHSGEWTSIADNTGECFAGTLHGDGHTISGLTKSLFNHLCGDIYNLGVTGSFTGAGIAETGSGYVENCWVKTSAPNNQAEAGHLETGTGHYAVFGNPSRTSEQIEENGQLQVVNCYYPKSNQYTVPTSDDHGVAIQKPDKAFYNGEVAYDLNGFYLYKRYADKQVSSGPDYKEYTYYTIDTETGNLSAPQTKYYGTTDAALCSSGINGNVKYVEDRFADGDFRYAGGFIPSEADERLYKDEDDNSHFYPIWPDDYLFFGQSLTYGYEPGRAHDEHPTYVLKDEGRLLNTEASNRVYRAPAYFRSKEMGVAHYNPFANLAAKSYDGTQEAYPGMTAIDFTGYQDYSNDGFKLGWAPRTTTSSWGTGSTQATAGTFFYPPLLDNDGLTGIKNHDETKNLLVYIPEATKESNSPANMTRTAVENNATDPDFSDYYSQDTHDPNHKYRTVATNTTSVTYHVVEQAEDASYQSTYNHFLVDKEEFNCPIEYTFVGGKRMWYQRTPDNYVHVNWTDSKRTTRGWENVSLPFTAELVTTNEKGEITHFYGNSKTGHEYWLREYKGGTQDTDKTFLALFNYPTPAESTADKMDKTVTNTYLWDHFYKNSSRHNHLDANNDTYQTYYNTDRFYKDYTLLTRGTPYIIGFPGQQYYEFDLSGQWQAENTAKTQPQLKTETPQIITFASAPNTKIYVSDGEMTGVSANDYVFKPNYLKETLKSVEVSDGTSQRSYALNATGDAYVAVLRPDEADPGVDDKVVLPFRPYFLKEASSGAKRRNTVWQINFDREENTFAFEDRDPRTGETSGALTFYVEGVVIGVKSTLTTDVPVQIVNTGGQTIASFTIHSGETIESPVPNTGVYIIRADKGRYNYKVTVK